MGSPPPALWPEGANSRANSPCAVMRIPSAGSDGATPRPKGRRRSAGSRLASLRRAGSSSERCATTADAEAADGEAGPGAHVADPAQPFLAEREVGPALEDGPQRLVARRHDATLHVVVGRAHMA